MSNIDPVAAAAAEQIPNEVPAEEMPDLKSEALEVTGDDEIRTVTVDGIEHEFALRKPTKGEFDTYFDAAHVTATRGSAASAFAIGCCLWPNRFRVKADERKLPALPNRLADELETWAGAVKPTVVDLSPKTAEGEERPLLTRYHDKNQLKRLTFTITPADWPDEDRVDIVLVVKRPERNAYETFIKEFQGSEKALACYNLAISCIVLPAEVTAVRELLSRHPGIAARLADTLCDMGGAGAKTRSKKR